MQTKGNITIPKSVRVAMGLTKNSLVRMKVDKGRLIMESVRTLPYPVRSYTPSEVEAFFKLDEKETKKLKAKGIL